MMDLSEIPDRQPSFSKNKKNSGTLAAIRNFPVLYLNITLVSAANKQLIAAEKHQIITETRYMHQ